MGTIPGANVKPSADSFPLVLKPSAAFLELQTTAIFLTPVHCCAFCAGIDNQYESLSSFLNASLSA